MDTINTLAFCVGGGTLLGSGPARSGAARGVQRIESMTLLASMLDFSDTGELGRFVDEAIRLPHARAGLRRGGRAARTGSSR
jgi:polyhydroxyalkanoate synthase